MSDDLAETPVVTRTWCPGCEPHVDPTRALVRESWCEIHAPGLRGADDARLGPTGPTDWQSTGEWVDADTNRAMNALLHRGRP